MKKLSLVVTALCLSAASFAQDAPFDEVEAKRQEKGLPKETVEIQEAIEQGLPGKAQRRRTPSLFRFGLKAGANYSVFQTTDTSDTATVTISGVGFEALSSFGWDLPYQPIFLEFQSGYRQLFTAATTNSDVLTITALHIVPIGFGFAYRGRIGPRSVMRVGVRPSLDFQIESTQDPLSGASSSSFAVAPTFGLWWGLELKDFLVEAELSVLRIQSQRNFLVSAVRLGYRF
jgi:hypothetical protein